jgi:hypothetical protein
VEEGPAGPPFHLLPLLHLPFVRRILRGSRGARVSSPASSRSSSGSRPCRGRFRRS